MLTRRNDRERSSPIIIQSNSNNCNSPTKGEYSLKQNFFDPSKCSPPNEFMIKLHMRIHKYHHNNDDNLEIK